MCCLLALRAQPVAFGRVLLAEHAGFGAARAGESIRVLIPPRSALPALAAATRRWNALAGWRLFVITEGPADIRFESRSSDPSCTLGCATVSPFSTGEYEACSIYVGPAALGSTSQADVAMHELGHCLGFAHQPQGVMSARLTSSDPVFERRLLERGGYAR